MSSELDLRGLHRPHAPDPAFVDALEKRLDAILILTLDPDEATDDREPLDLDLPASETRPSRRRVVVRTVIGIAAAVLLVVVGLLVPRDEPDSGEPPTAPIITPRANGWVAQDFGVGVILFRSGTSLDILVDGADECPTFSPDGQRLLFGQYDGSDASLGVVSIAADDTETRRGPDGQVEPAITRLATIQLPGVEAIPCAIWAPDGRWAALGGGGSVWVVDTETAAVRELAGYVPTDLEWRPGTDQLAITGRAVQGSFGGDNAPIDLYSVSSGEVHTIEDVEAAELAWSPDGSTLAYTQALGGSMKSGITLIDADGSNPRPLTTDGYVADHGIGITWSPRGDLIAYQRERSDCSDAACNERDCSGIACYERSEVVLVTATDTDPDAPIGSERAIPPISDILDGLCDDCRRQEWYANSVTWSPDGTKLLYSVPGVGTFAVSVDGAGSAVVLDEDDIVGFQSDDTTKPWLPLQQWQPAP